ncbi:MAG: hypothetical protein ACYC64_00240 [Armatimonadota bacterium]
MKPSLRFGLVLLLSVMFLASLSLSAFGRNHPRGRAYGHDDFRETGTATDIDCRRGDFLLRTRSNSYVITADRVRVQLNGGRVGTLRDLKRDALVTVVGERWSNRTVNAVTIIVLEDTGRFDYNRPPMGNPGYGNGRYEPMGCPRDRDERQPTLGRCDFIEGTIIQTAGFFTRAITVRTRYGDSIVNVEKSACVTRDRRGISVHDLRAGEKVLVSGRWERHLLVADRVEVIGRYIRPNDRERDDD